MAGQGQKTRAAKNREKRPSSRKRLKKGEVQDAVWNPKRRKREVEKKKADMPSTEEEEGGTLESPQIRKNSKKFVGAHVSIQGGIWNAVLVARQIGASAIGMFLGSQRTWKSKALDDKAAERFQRTCKELGFKSRYILPHSPYLMNLGSPKPDVLQKSQAMLVDELHKCHQLGLTMYNIHPGSCVGAMSVSKCLELIADGINLAHAQVPGVIVVLENMSCQGSTVGGRFEELRGIIDLVVDKSRIGVCLDTCHAFAAGHDLSKKAGLEHMLDEFNKVVGLSFLKAIHLNDSQGELGCKLDRHENIGHGHIGLEGFRHVMNEPRFNGIPMILETPLSSDDHAKEIELLYSLCAKGQRATKPKRKR
ncbi:uncharacterized protein LOC100127659 [Xenopus tropicalis]|uniref:LOC100127659 protein n=1 Tax=Xenopus tropicalis TaxID=8364 RepID=A8KBF9_XENTR|nr:uncharacterized protein LOC100127659 [Xenopus tropicalis]AAI54097.1 LOC100127659 protein [Xenopus tropicalis]|eukprot:NP_001106474.1 uncharacterized protein LOC100127659 [Xenopus tropicalis]